VRFFRRQPNNRRSVYLNLVGSIESQLREAFAKRHDEEGLTQSALAGKLGVDRSAINRRLTGRVNMTAETLADMVWGLGHCVKIEIYDPKERGTNETQTIGDYALCDTTGRDTARSVVLPPPSALGLLRVRT
jgi:DNA-binding XRE family transcriptional regulator